LDAAGPSAGPRNPIWCTRGFATLSFVYLAAKRTLLKLCIVTLSGCTAVGDAEELDESTEVRSQEQAIVYGTDDRQDLYEVDDPVLREVARSSVAALIKSSLVHRLATGSVSISQTTLGQTYHLCEGQRFEDEPAAATCSGVLIDKDLLITAGHCVETDDDCRTYSFVFDYAYGGES